MPGVGEPDSDGSGRAAQRYLPVHLTTGPCRLLPREVTAGHDSSGPVLGSEIIQHPGVLGRQREIGQRFGQLSQRDIHVPGTPVGSAADAGGTHIGENAVLTQDLPDNFEHLRVLDQVGNFLALG